MSSADTDVDGDAYIRLREERLRKNRQLLESLNIPRLVTPPSPPPTPKTPTNKRPRPRPPSEDGSAYESSTSEAEESPSRAKKVKLTKKSKVPSTPVSNGTRRTSRSTAGAPPSPVYSPGEAAAELPRSEPLENTYGAIPGIPMFKTWEFRDACAKDGVHRMIVGGIHGSPETGAYSVAMSGGYEDDVDLGEAFTYTGQGGRDLKGTKDKPKNLRTAPQSCDQKLERGNMALYQSSKTKVPVRVIRGFKLKSKYAPESGYR
ncbi:hypothetical protein HDU93_001482, partial [Gonapodya sp. JEL0774]